MPAREPAQPGALARRLSRTRDRTLALIGGVDEEALNGVHSPLLSPIVWDLGHIAAFEDLWLVQNAHGADALRDDLGTVYDPFAAARSERGALPYLRTADCFGYMETVRERTLAHLARADLGPGAGDLLGDGFVYEMVLRHEMQHTETILQTLQIMSSEAYHPTPEVLLPPAPEPISAGMVEVPGGPFEMGAGPRGFAYDNERPRHRAQIRPFRLGRAPVSNGEFEAFVRDSGYDRPELWSVAGWSWREQSGAVLPGYWSWDGDAFVVRAFGEQRPLDRNRPVCHVSWYEADAYARWAGLRLPTEAEWEKAASWDAVDEDKRAYPWGDDPPQTGRANLDQLAFATAPCGSYDDACAPCGAGQMLGDVWEWTASGFDGYPGFRAFPYREYSEEFLGGPFRVLRGGSWATQAGAVTTTFRNWDHPERRQLFAGFRCAQDA
jgi:iron(II)-dependent oxidoreductase